MYTDVSNNLGFYLTAICQFRRSVMSDSLRPHELQHTRLPGPSPTPGVHSDSRPSSQWCHPAISSSVVPFSSCPQSLPASESNAFHMHAQFVIFSSDMTEKAMAPHSSTLACKIPWTEKPGRLRSTRSRRVGHDWVTSLSLFTFMHWRRKWQPTLVFLRGESQGRWSLVDCHLWGRTE